MTTLLKGDCLDKMKSIPDKSVDLIICDLPYGCLTNKRDHIIDENNNKTIGSVPCAWDIKINLEKFWTEVKRIRKDEHTPTLHFCNTKFGYDLIKSNEKEFRYDLVWDKGRGVSFLSANKMPLKGHEMVYVFSKAGANYNRIDVTGEFRNTNKGGRPVDTHNVYHDFKNTPKESNEGKRCVVSIIKANTQPKKGQHPTAKPIELYKWLVSRYSKEGDTVLDPTFGSGNSGEACRELKRKYIGIEKDDNFFWKYVSKVDGYTTKR